MLSIEQIYRQDDWWDKINFSRLERNVRRLQGRIFTLCSSHILGNYYVWFLEGKGVAILLTYSTKKGCETEDVMLFEFEQTQQDQKRRWYRGYMVEDHISTLDG